MSSFTKDLIISPMSDGIRWQLVEPFIYEIGQLGSDDNVEVAAEFITDFASVPRFLWAIIPPWGRYGKAVILHDWLYTKTPVSRLGADTLFLEAMTVLKVPKWKRLSIYYAVRLFGGRNYKFKSQI